MNARQVLLLRGINLGSHKRIPMPELRERLASTGYEDAATYLQSGNIVLGSELPAGELADRFQRHIADWFGHDVPVLVRSESELAAVVAANPLRRYATDPKRYQVSFLAGELSGEQTERVRASAKLPERVAISGREVYAWHPEGVIRSPLAQTLGSPTLGALATARNWRTVTELLALARR